MQAPGMVTMSRADFDKLAMLVVQHNADKNIALANCNRDLTIKSAQDDAAQAMVDKQAFQLKLWAIISPIIAAGLTTAAAVIGYESRPQAKAAQR